MSKLSMITVVAVALASFTYLTVQAEPLVARSATAARGTHGAVAGQRGLVADGQGNVAAAGRSAVSGDKGSAQRSGSFTRRSDGTASGSRSTTATNAETGNTFEGSTTYTKGEGVSRSASCKDAAGNTIHCDSR